MANCLKIVYEDLEDRPAIVRDIGENRNTPFANSPVYEAFIQKFNTLSQGVDVKTVYQLKLALKKDVDFDFLPGDVIGILPENDEKEVKKLLARLNLEEVCNMKYSLEVLKDTSKKNVAIPKHVPQSGTLYDTFLKYIDIRFVPKKLFLKKLIQFTDDSAEKDELTLICSPSGTQEYHELITKNRDLLAILYSFRSCNLPVEFLLEHSSPLNPRYFSIASSPLNTHLSIIFNVMYKNQRKGLCTGWLERIITGDQFRTKAIGIYFRKTGNFRFTAMDIPSILVATGTGLAPFLGFLEHKKLLQGQAKPNAAETWLFYGCRYSSRDFLCGNELNDYLNKGVLTKLNTVFSRESRKKKYVQHRIIENKVEVVDILLNNGGVIFVCGKKKVVQDVKTYIVKCFMECRNLYKNDAENILCDLVESGRFLVDSWI